ncbi:type I-U CRISPR-associated protein Csx17 [Candidatus Micrarchaeota archaeon]|nr:type I-U CRISPR-associated protein Csx17 [Candidatus Micrarchaeota archaeon]
MTGETLDIDLGGCTTEPMSNYLKALGVFRLVAEQADSGARGCWKNGVFVLQTVLSKEDLTGFFLNKYIPTPIVSPWNKDGGFLGDKKASGGLDDIENSDNPRLEKFAETIKVARTVMEGAKNDGLPLDKIGKKEGGDAKSSLIVRLRNSLPNEAVRWIDAVLVITSTEADWAGFPMLGGGGNDGRADFSSLFIRRISTIFTVNPEENNKMNLQNSLFNLQTDRIEKEKFGQLNPSAVGNFNASTGFVSESFANPWDYVLALEGVLVFAGAAVRRYEHKQSVASMSFPFSVRPSTSGYGTAVNLKRKKYNAGEEIRSEMWLPTWEKPASINEIEFLFSEGRAEFGNRSAKNAIEFAQSVSSLGTDRGLDSFHRYAFIKRNGKAFFAVKHDTFDARGKASAEFLQDPIDWLGRNRKSDDSESKSIALKELEENLIRLCHRGFEDPEPAAETIAVLGRTVKESVRHTKGWNLNASKMLSSKWLEKANDGTPEYRLAASLASLLSHEFSRWMVNQHRKTARYNTDRVIVKDVEKWLRFTGEPVHLLNEIMKDRILRLQQAGLTNYSDCSKVSARLNDVNAFLEGFLDEKKMVDLLFGFMFLKWNDVRENALQSSRVKDWRSRSLFPGAGYAVAKLCYIGIKVTGSKIRLVPAIHKRLASGDGKKALELSVHRLHSDGCRIPGYASFTIPAKSCERIAAALLFPLGYEDITLLKLRLLNREEVGV